MADNVVTPLTFQFQPVLTGQGGANAPTSAPRLGINGAQNVRPDLDANRFNENLTASTPGGGGLPEFIEQAFAPKIQAEKQAKFWQGFVDARAGKSVQDINAEEPWYARLFGPTPYAQGADLFAAQKAGAEMEQAFMEQLPELRKQDGSQMGQWFADKAKSLQTGDVYADAIVTKTLMERAGTMMDAHTKARYAWQQEELAKGQYDAWNSAGRTFNTLMVEQAKWGRDHPGQAPDPAKTQEATRVFLQTLQSSPTLQNPESYATTLINTVESLAGDGQWYAVNAIQDTGILKMLPPDEQEKLDTHIETARNRARERIATSPEMITAVTQITSRAKAGAASAAQTVQDMTALNDLYTSMTGDKRGFFQMNDFVQHAGNAADAFYRAWEKQFDVNQRAREKAETEAAKQLADSQNDALLATAVGSNSLGTIVHMKGVEPGDASRVFNAALARNPAGAPLMIVGNYAARDPYIDDRLKTQLQTGVQLAAGEELTDGFLAAYTQFKAIRDTSLPTKGGTDRSSGVAAAAAYYGDYYAPMQKFDDAVRAGLPAEVAYRRVFGSDVSYGSGDIRGINSQQSKETEKEFAAAVTDLNPSWYEFGRSNLGSSAQNLVMHVASRYYEQIRRNAPEASIKDAVAEAVHAARANGLEIAGRYAWQNMRGQKPVAAMLGMESSTFENYFDDALSNKLRKQGMSLDDKTSLTILRMGDDANGPRLVATAYNDGKYKTVFLTGDDFKAIRNKQAEDDLERQRKGMATGMFDHTSILPQPKF